MQNQKRNKQIGRRDQEGVDNAEEFDS